MVWIQNKSYNESRLIGFPMQIIFKRRLQEESRTTLSSNSFIPCSSCRTLKLECGKFFFVSR